MCIHDATEIAYRNGFEAGFKKAKNETNSVLEIIEKMLGIASKASSIYETAGAEQVVAYHNGYIEALKLVCMVISKNK